MVKIENPDVTLDDEARSGVKEDVRSGFLDWLTSFVVKGDDGETYCCGGSILSLAVEQLDIVSIGLSKGFGKAQQLPSSIYKVGRYPGYTFNELIRQPKGTLSIERLEDKVIVTCGPQFKVECNADHTWHLFLDLPGKKYKAELWHRPHKVSLSGTEEINLRILHSIPSHMDTIGLVKLMAGLNATEIESMSKVLALENAMLQSIAPHLNLVVGKIGDSLPSMKFTHHYMT